MKLKNKIAIITGGSGDIGRAVARALLKEGASVMLAARKEASLEAAKTELATLGTVETCRCDVAETERVKSLVDKTVERFGRVDIVVNAAGTYGPIGRSEEVDFDVWKQAFGVNTFGTFDVIRRVIPLMKKQGRGKIINFSGGGDGPLPRISGYSASKFAVIRLTETLAAEHKDDHIDINVIAPGAVITKLFEEGLAAGKEALGDETYAKLLKQKEEGGVPAEKAAALCVYLASDDSNGLTGKFLSAVWDKWQEFDSDKIKALMASDALTARRKKDE